MDHFRFYISFSWPSAALAVADVSISTLIDGSQFPFREAFNFFRQRLLFSFFINASLFMPLTLAMLLFNSFADVMLACCRRLWGVNLEVPYLILV